MLKSLQKKQRNVLTELHSAVKVSAILTQNLIKSQMFLLQRLLVLELKRTIMLHCGVITVPTGL